RDYLRKCSRAENLQRHRGRRRIEWNLPHQVVCPAVVVGDAVSAASVPAETGGAERIEQILVRIVIPNLGDPHGADDFRVTASIHVGDSISDNKNGTVP